MTRSTPALRPELVGLDNRPAVRCPRLWGEVVKNEESLPLRRMRGQRREHAPGDWFALQLNGDGSYRVGVVVKIGEHTPAARFPGGILAYLFEPAFAEIPAEAPGLGTHQLVMPPFFTHRKLWSLGYFRTFAQVPLRPGQLLPRHCFLDGADEEYVDENDQVIDRRHEPCGRFSLASLAALAEEVAEAVAGELKPVRRARNS